MQSVHRVEPGNTVHRGVHKVLCTFPSGTKLNGPRLLAIALASWVAGEVYSAG